MSGLAGIYNLDGSPVDRASLQRMTALITHRGPDQTGCWINGPVGLAQTMLFSTPESLLEKQPLSDEMGELCLTLDGRIDNRHDLRAALEARGARLRTGTDAELVLRAYEIWDEECPAKMIGDFAFAVWDRRSHRLFCARDPLGMRSFYYHYNGRAFLFASEMQPLFEGSGLPRRLNLPLIGLYLSNWFDEREETLYSGIYRLPAAHSLTVEGRGLRKRQYWDVDPAHAIRYRTDAEYAEHFLGLFREAVRCRLRSHGPVGIALSGGLDSSSIACAAQALYKDGDVANTGFESFSIIFDTLPCDERRYIGEVVHKWGIKANFVTYEEMDASWLGFEQAQRYPDAFYEPTCLMYIPAFLDMQRRGIKVLLDGLGGDELLAASFAHLTDLMQARKLRDLIRQIAQDARIYSTPPVGLFLDYCVRPLVPRALKRALRPLANLLRGGRVLSLINPAFAKAWGLEERLRAGVEVTKFPTRAQQEIYDGLFFGWNVTSTEMNELFTARFSLEGRRPFFDRRVVEFLLAVPEEHRWRGDQPKFILRQAMEGILPDAVRWRAGKAEFSALIDQELKQRQAQTVEAIFRHSVLADLGILDSKRFLRLFARYRGGTRQYLTGLVELALQLELWCRTAMGVPTHGRRSGHGATTGSDQGVGLAASALHEAATH